MSIRAVRYAVVGFFLLYLLVVTWPVGTFFGGAEPFVFGLPFSFFWPALWIVLGGIVLALLDWAEERERRQGSGGTRPGPERSGPTDVGRGEA
jgi:hypothetical protein